MKVSSIVSVPSFGDSFFMIAAVAVEHQGSGINVSVPSFGDSFFIYI